MDTKTNSHIDSSDLKSNIMFDLARGGIELDFRSCRKFFLEETRKMSRQWLSQRKILNCNQFLQKQALSILYLLYSMNVNFTFHFHTPVSDSGN